MDSDRQVQFRYSITKDLPRADVLALYRAAGWFGPSDPAPELDAMLANSFAVSAAFDAAGHRLTDIPNGMEMIRHEAIMKHLNLRMLFWNIPQGID